MRVLLFLLRKEFLQIVRDRVIVRLLFVMPLAQLLLLANAATFEVRSARLQLVDHDRSAQSRAVVARLAASGRFVPVGTSASAAQGDATLRAGTADVVLVVPAGFARDLARSGRATVQLLLDAGDGAAAGVTQAYATQILERHAAELAASGSPARAPRAAAVAAGLGPEPPPRPGRPTIEVRQRGWYNPALRYRDYMVPAILVVLVTTVATLLTAMNVVREKEAGTLDQLNVTPLSRATFIAAKLLPLWSIALVDLALGLAVGHWVFDVPIRGSLALVFGAAGLYLAGALGLGLWISTVAETQQQAMFVTFAVVMVYLLMSGVYTPVAGMPPWARWLAQASPVLHFARLMRAVLLKGAGPADVARELAMLALIGGTVLTLAVRRYRKRVA